MRGGNENISANGNRWKTVKLDDETVAELEQIMGWCRLCIAFEMQLKSENDVTIEVTVKWLVEKQFADMKRLMPKSKHVSLEDLFK